LQGDLSEAHKLLHEAVTIAAAVNHEETLCFWQPILGLVALYRGDTTEARRLLTESLQRCIEYKEKSLLARNCTHLAELALWEGELDEAAAVAGAAPGLPRRAAVDHDPRGDAVSGSPGAWPRRSRSTCAPPRCSAWPTRRTARSTDAIGGPVRALADAALATVQAALEPAVFAEAFAAGRQLSRAGAIGRDSGAGLCK
jgi:hypothetical protein